MGYVGFSVSVVLAWFLIEGFGFSIAFCVVGGFSRCWGWGSCSSMYSRGKDFLGGKRGFWDVGFVEFGGSVMVCFGICVFLVRCVG